MPSTPRRIIGVDIAKEKIDIHDLQQEKHRIVLAADYSKWVESLAQDKPDLIVMEASGGYQRDLVTLLAAAGIPFTVLNPRRVRDYAKSIGHFAKTDKIDARVIARYAEVNNLQPQPPPDASVAALRDLVARRRQLVEFHKAERNREQQARHPRVKKDIAATLKFLEKQIAKLEQDMDHEIKNTPSWHETEKLLVSVPGVGQTTARALIAEMPELGQLNRQKIAYLAGLAPLNDDSGKHSGQRHIQGGRASVRNALYMATVSATRHNPYIREFFQRLRNGEKAKKYKVALTACMRKMLLLLNSLVKTQKPFSMEVAGGTV